MCDYCDQKNSMDSLCGEDGIYYDGKSDAHFLFIEHFFREVYQIPVNFCPRCGRKLAFK